LKAVRFHAFGNADVLAFEEAPEPSIGPGDVIVRLKAAAINHLDLWVRSGERERNIPLPHIPGCDGAGIVHSVGHSVTAGQSIAAGQSVAAGQSSTVGQSVASVKPGDAVLISPGLSCGSCTFCLSGRDTFCREYRVLGTREDGTYAEFVKLPAANVVPIPDGLSFVEAAAVPLVFLTAWHMLRTLARIQSGETALVHGAGSGVGSAAIQIAKHAGARVIATAGSAEKLAKARELGADELINYKETDFAAEVRRLTEKRGVDVVFEHIGGDIFEKSIPIIARGGRLVTCGATTAFTANVDIRYIYSRQQAIYGSWMGWKPELIEVMKFFDKKSPKRFRPVIDTIIPLAQAADAHRRMEERKNFGKIVLEI
jgi:NADPH:quinone reductase-like Zn-dependent oxidoreductase